MDTGRPARDETTDYYYKYIDLVPEGDIRRILEDQQREALGFFESIPEARAKHRYAPDKWSVAEVLCHVNDSERLYSLRAFWFARGLATALPSFEPELVVKTARPEDLPFSALVREFGSARASTLAFYRNLHDDAWQRRGVASDMPFSVRALAYLAAGHVIHHMAVLRERYL